MGENNLNTELLFKNFNKIHFPIGTIALHEIRKNKYSKNFLISKHSFKRLVKELVSYICGFSIRFTKEAIYALQVVTEDFIVRLFEDCNKYATRARRVTIISRDLYLTEQNSINK